MQRVGSPAGRLGQVHLLERTGGRVAVVGGFGFGAPVATIVMENLVALGVERFVSMGTAGGLQPGQAFGDVVVCTAAVRDEGVSHHYVPPARWAHPDAELTARLADELDDGGRGGRGRDGVDDRHALHGDRRRGAPLPGPRRGLRRDGGGRAVQRGRAPGCTGRRRRSR